MSGSSSSRVLLGDLCTLIVEQVDPLTTAQDRCYIGLEHLRPGRLRVENSGRATDVQSHKFAFVKGDVLYGKLRPYLDKAILADVDGICTTELLVLRAKAGITPEFLVCAIHSPEFIEHAMSGVTGAHHPRTSWGHISTFEVSSLSESQQRVASQLLWRIQNLIVKCERGIITAQKIKYETMNQLFARGLRGEAQKETEIGLVPESWEVVQLGSLGKIGNGSTPKKTVPEYWIGGTYPWLTSAKVYDREITSADQFVTDTALAKCHLPRVKPGAVLMAITGQGKTLGHCAVLTIEASVSQHVAYLQTDTSKADPSFVRGYLETQYEYLRQVASGGGSTKGALTCAFLKGLPIPLPELPEQREIVTILDAIDKKIELHLQKKSVLDELFRSLLHKLMTGEISVEDLDLSALTSEEPQPKTEAEMQS